MRTANPALNESTFRGVAPIALQGDEMTISGTVNKTFLLTLIVFGAAAYTWNLFLTTGAVEQVNAWMIGGVIGGLIMALLTVFKKSWAPFTAPLYAAFEGLTLGGLSSFLETLYPGIVIQAIALTLGTLFALLFAYKTGLIKATENFKLGVAAATGGVFLIYLVTFILGFFNIQVPFIHESGTVGIILSLVIVTIAALNLVLDFDFIEHAAASQRVPKYMEWYAAFGLMVTLIWLYVEILRLLTKLRQRD